MLKSGYFDYIYKVDGETINVRPEKIFEPTGVYLIIDREFKIIWIWAGNHSRLFHRYMAANWAGKLKTKKKFFNFKYEVIKQGIEPLDFNVIFKEIKENRTDLNYPGESRAMSIKELTVNDYASNIAPTQVSRGDLSQDSVILSKTEKSRIRKIFSEIKEKQMHIKYSIEHIQQRFAEIEKILGS